MILISNGHPLLVVNIFFIIKAGTVCKSVSSRIKKKD